MRKKEEVKAELRSRFLMRCQGNTRCIKCKLFIEALKKGVILKPIDCLEAVAIDMILEGKV